MYENKENYEAKIKASPLFSLEKGTAAYNTELHKMQEYVYCYLMRVNESKYGEFALEIFNTLNSCIKNYKNDGTEFLNYFNAAWAKEYRRAYAKQNAEVVRGGIHITEDDDRNIRKILKFAEQKHITEYTESFIKLAAMMLDMDEAKVRNYIEMNSETAVVSEYTTNDDGEEVSVFDTVASAEAFECDEEERIAILDVIEKTYKSLQERQKPIISAIMTTDICKTVCDYSVSVEEYTFIDHDILEEYILHGSVPTKRAFASKFGKNEASISRTKREFIEKIKNALL